MPQMAPYNWLFINLMFTMILIFYICMIYFFNIYKSFTFNKKLLSQKSKKLKW